MSWFGIGLPRLGDFGVVDRAANTQFQQLVAKQAPVAQPDGTTVQPTTLGRDAFVGSSANAAGTKQFTSQDFERFDANKDGQIDKGEFQKGFQGKRMYEQFLRNFSESMMNEIAQGLTKYLKR